MAEHRCTEFESHAGWWRCKTCRQPIPRYETVADTIAAMRAKLATTRWRDKEQREPVQRKARTKLGPIP
jgi:hypothetical protein